MEHLIMERRNMFPSSANNQQNKHTCTIKFLNFRMPEIVAVIYLKFKQRSQIFGYFIKKMQMELKTV